MANASGVPGWIDLATEDVAAAREFYSELFGWEIRIVDDPQAQGYTVFLKNGKPVAGAGPKMLPDEPSMWTMSVATDDAQAVTAKVEGAGGKVLIAPMDVFDFGRLAVFMDTANAIFAVWQAGTRAGGEVFNEPGAYTWSELNTRETEAAKEFYRHVFGWTATDHTYVTTFKLNGVPVGGMVEMPAFWPEAMRNHWLNYVAVADTDAAVAKVTRLGGGVFLKPTDIEPGRFAVVSDPQGAILSVITRDPGFQPG